MWALGEHSGRGMWGQTEGPQSGDGKGGTEAVAPREHGCLQPLAGTVRHVPPRSPGTPTCQRGQEEGGTGGLTRASRTLSAVSVCRAEPPPSPPRVSVSGARTVCP